MVVQEGSLHYQLIKDRENERLREIIVCFSFLVNPKLLCSFWWGGFVTIMIFDLYMCSYFLNGSK